VHICSRSHARSTLADLTPNIRPAARFLVATTPGGALRGTRKKPVYSRKVPAFIHYFTCLGHSERTRSTIKLHIYIYKHPTHPVLGVVDARAFRAAVLKVRPPPGAPRRRGQRPNRTAPESTVAA
jgi:hypothetical protein